MKKAALSALFLIFGVAVLLAIFKKASDDELTTPHYPLKKTLRYSFEIQNTSVEVFRGGSIWAYAPVLQTSFQKVDGVTVSGAEFEVEKDHLGNQTLNLKLPAMAPGGRKTVTVTVSLAMSDEIQPQSDSRNIEFLGSEPFIETDSPEIRQFALGFSEKSPLELATTIKTTVGNHIEYSGYVRENLGALYAYREKRGDCTEYMSLATAVFRVNNVPARAVAGFVVEEGSALLSSSDYHNWTEFYDGQGWQILDAQNQILAEKQDQYIVFRILSGQGDEQDARFSERFISPHEQLRIRLI
ncbi:MAG: transglutaminase-like domain-containing protein [Endozoicomonas sp.]|uniref:transglutaminase-like domain-containing protein n=1 Tax=Endozoicomonas sp. TaxID=1892382 RepID=UPI003D9B2990